MRRIRIRLIGAVVLAVLTLAGTELAGLSPGPSNAYVPPVPAGWEGQIRTANHPCLDVVFIGARGSGQDAEDHGGFGREVRVALNAYLAAVKNRRVGYLPVNYPAHDVDLLAVQRRRYFAGLDDGIDDTLAFLTTRTRRCPTERYVLAGYSQGAIVMHRTLWAPAVTNGLVPRNRIDGVILIADGDRADDTGIHTYGSSPARATWSGVSLAWTNISGTKYKALNRRFPLQLRPRVHSICDRTDIVCDYRPVTRSTFTQRTRVHTSNYTGEGAHRTERAARAAAALTMRRSAHPSLSIAVGLPAGTIGQPYSTPLTARGGVAPYAYKPAPPATTLPGGWNVTRDGTLAGTPTAATTGPLWVRVTDARGQFVDAPLTVKAAEPPVKLVRVGEIGSGWNPLMSGDGQWVAYQQQGEPGSEYMIRLWSRVSGQTTTVTNADLLLGISFDGRFIVYLGNSGPYRQIYRWDRDTGTSVLVTHTPDGSPSAGEAGLLNGWGGNVISADGRYIVFSSWADDLVEPRGDSEHETYLWDAVDGSIERLHDGYDAPPRSWAADISYEGTVVAYKALGPYGPEGSGSYSSYVYVWTQSGTVGPIGQDVASGDPVLAPGGDVVYKSGRLWAWREGKSWELPVPMDRVHTLSADGSVVAGWDWNVSGVPTCVVGTESVQGGPDDETDGWSCTDPSVSADGSTFVAHVDHVGDPDGQVALYDRR